MSEWLAENDADLVEKFAEVEFDDCDDPVDLVHTAARLRVIAKSVSAALTATERRLAKQLRNLPHGKLRVEGLADVSVYRKKDKPRYEGGRLAHVVAGYIADQRNGEPMPPAALAHVVADELIDVFSLSQPSTRFKSSAVKARGLEPNDFVEFEYGEDAVKWLDAS